MLLLWSHALGPQYPISNSLKITNSIQSVTGKYFALRGSASTLCSVPTATVSQAHFAFTSKGHTYLLQAPCGVPQQLRRQDLCCTHPLWEHRHDITMMPSLLQGDSSDTLTKDTQVQHLSVLFGFWWPHGTHLQVVLNLTDAATYKSAHLHGLPQKNLWNLTKLTSIGTALRDSFTQKIWAIPSQVTDVAISGPKALDARNWPSRPHAVYR